MMIRLGGAHNHSPIRVTPAALVAAVALATLLLAGCSTTPFAPAKSSGQGASTAPTSAEATVAPPKSLSWESACMMTVGEVANVMQPYSWKARPATEPGDGFAGDTSCLYSESDPSSIRRVSLDFRPYAPTTDYGWMSANSSVPSFAAPNASDGARNACATASAAAGNAGDSVCTTAGGVPVVVSPSGLTAMVFPGDKFLYIVQLYDIAGSTESKTVLLALATLVANRPLIAN